MTTPWQQRGDRYRMVWRKTTPYRKPLRVHLAGHKLREPGPICTADVVDPVIGWRPLEHLTCVLCRRILDGIRRRETNQGGKP